ncbi:MAG: DUF2062 domain-containing protein [Candidatus Promineofilum sp.]|nr:DUF2062 domain-containing protein [Promineifilum sp.]
MKAINFAQLKEMALNRVDRIRREALAHWREMTAAEAPAGEMATAFAAGTLVSTIPVPLVDMAIAAFIMRRFDKLPRAPFFTAMALTNNLVMAPLYASTPKVGGLAIHWMSAHTPVAAPEVFVVKVLVGYVMIALGLALGSFVLANTGFRGLKLARRSS